MLVAADGGNFREIFVHLNSFFKWIFSGSVWQTFFYFIVAIPVALYICGLVAGNAHRRYVNGTDLKQTAQNIEAGRIVPVATINTILVVVSVVYVIFIGCQIPYFFSAFAGVRPSQYLVYAEYARDGFFELCTIAGINMALLLGSNLLCKVPRGQNKALRLFNIVLAALTMLLIATALSKMALYIGAYGLSVRRTISSVFMLFLAGVYGAVIVLQYKQFSIMRFAVGLGSVMLCALCLVNVDGLAVRYNANQYIAGNLANFDTDLLYRGGATSVQAGLDVLAHTNDVHLQNDIKAELAYYFSAAQYTKGTARITLDAWRIQQMELPKK
ncbi:DUF4173 domain-containing protein [Ruminococcaceae bacterium OttesenSCG-928-A16]|nr:DUF4173 domain-containing protein [Ruminococcaceae bacterium OttesenSCG-928-A16]